MKIESPQNQNSRIVTWDQVVIRSDDGHEVTSPIRSIRLNVEAGDVAVLEIETYGIDTAGSINVSHDSATTTTNSYVVEKILIETKERNRLIGTYHSNIPPKQVKSDIERIREEQRTKSQLEQKRRFINNPILGLEL